MNKRTSLKDIAQAVGVSVTLVSYVLNNQNENRIDKEVAKKIRQAAQDLNYQPNVIAKSLKTNQTRTLGLIVVDIANPFSAALARIVEDEANQHGYTLLFGSSDGNPQKCQQLITTLQSRRIDGLLIASPPGIESQLIDLHKQQVPFVLIDRYFPQLKTSYVALDNYQALYQATQHLLEVGYRRIGLITYKTSLFNIQERTRGYCAALEANAIQVKKEWIKELGLTNLERDMGKAIQELSAGPQAVDAVVFISNTLTLAGLRQLKALGRLVPSTFGLVGFDESEVYDLLTAPLTYVQQPLQQIGQLATRILLETLRTPTQLTQVNLEANVVIQASTKPLFCNSTNSR